MDKLVPSLRKAAWRLEREIEGAVGFRAAVYPVVAVWGRFDAGVQFAGNVTIVRGDRLVEHLQTRKRDLYRDQPQRVAAYIATLPHFASK